MTVSAETTKNTYTGDASTLAFAFSFPIQDESHLLVQLKNSAGTITTQTITTHYTVSGTGNEVGETNYTSGTVTFVSAPAATDTVIIARDVPITQETDYTVNGPFSAQTHEDALDKLTMLAQEQEDKLNRAVRVDITTSSSFDAVLPTVAASKYITINASANGFSLADDTSVLGPLAKTDGNFYVGDGTTIVAESGATARTSMGVGTGDSPQFTAVNIGHASDTTVARANAGDLSIEGNLVYRAGGTDVPVTDGGTGASTAAGARTNLSVPEKTDVLADDTSPQLRGPLDANSNLINNVTDPVSAQDAATKNYVDTRSGTGTGFVTLDTTQTISGVKTFSAANAYGTPASVTLTNATGLPISTGVSGLGAGVAGFLATPSSANLATAVTDETGSGALVFANTPSLVTPDIGAATGTSINLGSSTTINGFIDDDTFATASATTGATSESIKAYSDLHAKLSGGSGANFTLVPEVAGDAIVEKGSNANGEYTRFSDGLQIAISNLFSSAADAAGSGTYANPYSTLSLSWTFPAAFISIPIVLGNAYVSLNNNDIVIANIPNVNTSGSGDFRIVALSSGVAGDTANARLVAIGYWK